MFLRIPAATLFGFGVLILGPQCMAQSSAQNNALENLSSSYEVATIKPWSGQGPFIPLQVYISGAYGLPLNSENRLIGPGWIKEARYVINAKVPDTTRNAMSTMSNEDRLHQVHTMQQTLLTERFKLKAHWESRELRGYELIQVTGGLELKVSLADSKQHASVGSTPTGSMQIIGVSLPIKNFIDLLMSTQELGGQSISDQTGLKGSYDVRLEWAPTSKSDMDGPSLFTALREELGLRLVAKKLSLNVLVIDSIERPSEN